MTRRLVENRWVTRAVAVAAPAALAAAWAPFRGGTPNTNAALVMVILIVALAVSGDRLAGVLVALSSGAWFDFFLTRPYETFSIAKRQDVETGVLLLAAGVVVTEIALWGRRQHARAALSEGYLKG